MAPISRIYFLPEGAALEVSLQQLPDIGEEVHAFLGAHFRSVERGGDPVPESLWLLRMVCDAGVLRHLVPVATPFTAEDHGATPTLGVVDEGGGSFWLVDEDAGTCVHWNVKDRTLVVVYEDVGPSLVEAIYTSVRTLVTHMLMGRGARIVHASAVAYRGEALVLLGEKGAGKTTLASAMLEQGAHFLASDRCWIWPSAEGWQVVGWMGTYRLRPADFSKIFREPTTARLEAFAEAARRSEANYFAGKLRCPPLTFLELGSWQPAYQAPLQALVMLEPGSAGHGLSRTRASPAQMLAAHLVQRRLPPSLAPEPQPPQTWPDMAVACWIYAGRRAPQEMAGTLCRMMDP